MSVDKIIGLTLESCGFSKSSYTFEFSGKKDGEFYTFLASTSYSVSTSSKDGDVYENFSVFIWPFLERRLTDIKERDDGTEIVLEFEGGKYFKIWGEEPVVDNLLVVRERGSENWFTIS